MRHPIVLFILVFGLLFSSCGLNLNKESAEKIKLQTISINEEYSMGIPAYMTKTTSLNDDASLQFQNIFKEAYVIVIDEDKKAFVDTYKELEAYDSTRSVLSNYVDTQVQSTLSNMNVISKKAVKASKINGLNAATTEIDSTVEGIKIPITYFLTFVDGKEKLYMIMAWTLQDKKDTYRTTFDQMVKSFRVLKKNPLVVK
jgi:hypothetical protein